MVSPPFPNKNTEFHAIDHRVYEKYDNSIFKESSPEATCMKSTYNFFGIIPKVCCICCAPCGKGPVVKVPSGFVGLRISFGEVMEKMAPGLHTINTCTESMKLIDIRSFMVNCDQQSIITKDGIVVKLSSFAVCRVLSPEISYFNVEKCGSLLKIFMIEEIAGIVSAHTLDQFMIERHNWEKQSLNSLNTNAYSIGMTFELLEIQDVQISRLLQTSMSQNALAKQQAVGKLIVAQGELNGSKLFKKAADCLSTNKMSIQLQYIELLKEMAKELDSKIILPDNILGGWDKIMKM